MADFVTRLSSHAREAHHVPCKTAKSHRTPEAMNCSNMRATCEYFLWSDWPHEIWDFLLFSLSFCLFFCSMCYGITCNTITASIDSFVSMWISLFEKNSHLMTNNYMSYRQLLSVNTLKATVGILWLSSVWQPISRLYTFSFVNVLSFASAIHLILLAFRSYNLGQSPMILEKLN